MILLYSTDKGLFRLDVSDKADAVRHLIALKRGGEAVADWALTDEAGLEASAAALRAHKTRPARSGRR